MMDSTERKGWYQKMFIPDLIADVLLEEEEYFRTCHHRDPIGREREDVVDNAWTDLQQSRVDGLTYIDVVDVYNDLRCIYA